MREWELLRARGIPQPFQPTVITKTGLDILRYICSGGIRFGAASSLPGRPTEQRADDSAEGGAFSPCRPVPLRVTIGAFRSPWVEGRVAGEVYRPERPLEGVGHHGSVRQPDGPVLGALVHLAVHPSQLAGQRLGLRSLRLTDLAGGQPFADRSDRLGVGLGQPVPDPPPTAADETP